MVNATAGLTHETAVSKAKEIADRALAPAAGANDKAGRFSTEAVEALGQAGLLGLTLSAEVGGAGLGALTFSAVTATPAGADASAAIVYLIHEVAAATIVAARPGGAVAHTLKCIAG